MPGQDEPVAGVVALAAADDRSRTCGRRGGHVDPHEPAKDVRRAPPSVLHEHQAGNAVLLGGPAIDPARLFASQRNGGRHSALSRNRRRKYAGGRVNFPNMLQLRRIHWFVDLFERPVQEEVILMPIYEYSCTACGQEFEVLIRGQEKPVCPSCGTSQLTKNLSVPAAHTATPQPSGCPVRESCGAANCCGNACGMGEWLK